MTQVPAKLDFSEIAEECLSALATTETVKVWELELPTKSQLAHVLTVAFWTSLRRDEGRDLRFSLSL